MSGEIELIQGDITKLQVDAIVNAANNSLLGGGGVDGAIHRAGGPEILEECKKIGGCETGEAVITIAGKLPVKHVIHTVGPVWNGGNHNEDELLRSCYKNALRVAEENGLNTVAFPNISTGVYHFPKKRAADIAIQAVRAFLENDNTVKKVIFVCFDRQNNDLYAEILGT